MSIVGRIDGLLQKSRELEPILYQNQSLGVRYVWPRAGGSCVPENSQSARALMIFGGAGSAVPGAGFASTPNFFILYRSAL